MSNNPQFFGPLPYLAFNNPSAGTAISPFSPVRFTYFHLEDFEDGALNTPGVTVSELATTNITTAFSDSVDGDDGVIDGQARGNSSSLFSNFRTSSFTFKFSANALGGQLPTHAGIVWTDIGRNGGGTPLSGDLVNNTLFEGFGPSGESLGIIGPFSLGDESISRTTSEDRFFGVVNQNGISSIRLSMPGKNNWEVDHLQYGFTPGTISPSPFGPNGLFFNLSTDADNFTIDPARVGNLLVQGLDGNDFIQGSPSADRVNGNVGNDTILGGDGNDTLWGGRDNDRIDGNAGNDIIAGNLGNDTLFGGSGDDILRGGQNNDVLVGGEGNDQLVGDFGRDILTGEAGNDLFVLRVNTAASNISEADVIADFTAGQDAIALTNGLAFAGIALDASGSNTAIRIVATGQILGVVTGVQPAALSAANFTTLNGDF
ncbi:calcium-binding protein [Microcoleus sp. herbarium12]|uniref:calcium-binding protein n=1 Tax=Microcoleus sp. herbarium12 TaxID=3055437 RepID=UPI002FD1F02D